MTPLSPVEPEINPPDGKFSRMLSRCLAWLRVDEVPHIKRVIVTVVGGTIVLFGFLLILSPVPAVLIIPVGFAILGTEYAWARRSMRQGRLFARKAFSMSQRILLPRRAAARAEASGEVALPVAAAAAPQNASEIVED